MISCDIHIRDEYLYFYNLMCSFVITIIVMMLVPMHRYPKMTEEDFLKECPVCQVNCNCKSCLRLEIPVAVSFLFAQFNCLYISRCLIRSIKLN